MKLTAIIFIICGLGSIVGGLFYAYDIHKKIQTWEDVEGTVVDSKVVDARVDGRKGYTVLVTYSYELDGKTYQSDIYPGGRSTIQAGKMREAASYVIGSTRLLSVNPSNPHEIRHVLGYDFGTFWGMFLFFGLGLLFVVIGIMIMKPPKVDMDSLEKFIPRAFIVIGIVFVAGASLAYINNPESLVGPLFFWIFGLFFIVIPILYLRNVAKGTAKTQVSISVVGSGKHAIVKAKGIANVLYSPAKRHTNSEEKFLREIARFGARNMDKIGRIEKIRQINIWAEGSIPLQDGSGQRIWKGVRLVLDKENWRGPMIGDLSNLAALDQWQYFKHCSFHYVGQSEFPKWPKIRSGPG